MGVLFMLLLLRIGTGQDRADLEEEALRATVRIMSAEGSSGHTGTGTIIGEQSGYAIVLTAEHVLPARGAECEIQFWPHNEGSGISTNYRVLAKNAAADLALMRVLVPRQAKIPGLLPLVPGESRLAPPLPVLTVGCGGGQPPTCENCQLTELRRRQHDGGTAEFWYTDREPAQGRSGGALLLGRYVIGVCSAGGSGKGIYACRETIYALCDQAQAEWLYDAHRQPPPMPVSPIDWSAALSSVRAPHWVDPAQWRAQVELVLRVEISSPSARRFLVPIPFAIRLADGLHLIDGEDSFVVDRPGATEIPINVEYTARSSDPLVLSVEPQLRLPDLPIQPESCQSSCPVAPPPDIVTTVAARTMNVRHLGWHDIAQGTAKLEAVVAVEANGPLGDRTSLALTAPPGVQSLEFSPAVIRPGLQTIRMDMVAQVAPAPRSTRLVFPFQTAPAGAIDVQAAGPLVIDAIGPSPLRLTLVDAHGRRSPFQVRRRRADGGANISLHPVLADGATSVAPPDLLVHVEASAPFPVTQPTQQVRLAETAILQVEPTGGRLSPPLLRDSLTQCQVTIRPALPTPAAVGSTHIVTVREEALLVRLLPLIVGGTFVVVLVSLCWRLWTRLADDRWENDSYSLP